MTREEQEQQEQKHFAWCVEKLNKRVVLKDDSPITIARQLGKPMTPEALEKLVYRLNPSIQHRVNPNVSNKKAFYIVSPGGVETTVCCYENRLMPEYSLFGLKREKSFNPAMFGPDRQAVQRDMVADAKRSPVSFSKLEDLATDKGVGAVESYIQDHEKDTAELGAMEIEVLGREILRGWRTVLAILATGFLVSPTLVDKYVDDSGRASWAAHIKGSTVSEF